jgi:hypothetical protein
MSRRLGAYVGGRKRAMVRKKYGRRSQRLRPVAHPVQPHERDAGVHVMVVLAF